MVDTRAKATAQTATAVVLTETAITCLSIRFSGFEAILLFMAVYLPFLILFFSSFLFSMARNPAGRTAGAAVIFIAGSLINIISLFGGLYQRLGLRDTLYPSADTSFAKSVYFSIVTWTTLGYGDVVPLEASRFVAASEAVAGYVIMGLLIAVLISLVQEK